MQLQPIPFKASSTLPTQIRVQIAYLSWCDRTTADKDFGFFSFTPHTKVLLKNHLEKPLPSSPSESLTAFYLLGGRQREV